MKEMSPFSLGGGKMKGVKVKFHIDPNVPPVACRKKTVPYHLEAKLDEAVERMERDGGGRMGEEMRSQD